MRLGSIPLKRYTQLTGETANAVYLRVRRGIWKRGVHVHQPEGAGLWVNLGAVREWVEGDIVNAVARLVESEAQSSVPAQGHDGKPDLARGVDPVA